MVAVMTQGPSCRRQEAFVKICNAVFFFFLSGQRGKPIPKAIFFPQLNTGIAQTVNQAGPSRNFANRLGTVSWVCMRGATLFVYPAHFRLTSQLNGAPIPLWSFRR